jgi:hypothetical protein
MGINVYETIVAENGQVSIVEETLQSGSYLWACIKAPGLDDIEALRHACMALMVL